MNYIQQLREENAQLRARLNEGCINLEHFRIFLQTSPKFRGDDTDGERKDWIATSDVVTQLSNIRDTFHGLA